MADHAKILAFIETCSDAAKLRSLRTNAVRQGAQDVEEAAFRRLISIAPEAEPGSLDHDFWAMIHAFELILSDENGKTTRLSRTRQKVSRVGLRAVLQDWAIGKQTEGFGMLLERGLPELTGEAIIVKHAAEFSAETVEAARRRLAEASHPQPAPDL